MTAKGASLRFAAGKRFLQIPAIEQPCDRVVNGLFAYDLLKSIDFEELGLQSTVRTLEFTFGEHPNRDVAQHDDRTGVHPILLENGCQASVDDPQRLLRQLDLGMTGFPLMTLVYQAGPRRQNQVRLHADTR